MMDRVLDLVNDLVRSDRATRCGRAAHSVLGHAEVACSVLGHAAVDDTHAKADAGPPSVTSVTFRGSQAQRSDHDERDFSRR